MIPEIAFCSLSTTALATPWSSVKLPAALTMPAIAGIVLGIDENLTSLYWGNEWALVVDFAIFLLVLSLRPAGLFGSQRV